MSRLTDRRHTAVAGHGPPHDGGRAQHDTRLRRTLLAVLLTGAGLELCALVASGWQVATHPDSEVYTYLIEGAVGLPVMGLLGVALIVRRPDNRISWVFAGIALAVGAQQALGAYAHYALFADPRLPLGSAAYALSSAFQAAFVTWMLLLIVLFPDGQPLTRRWRGLHRVGVALVPVALVATLLDPGVFTGEDHPRVAAMSNPFGVAGLNGSLGPLLVALVLVVLGGALAQLALRYRRSRGEERLQIKWFTYLAMTGPLLLLLPLPGVGRLPGWALWSLVPISLPLAIAIAVLRYRLYDIDVAISKTVVFAGLAAFITAIYVGIVVGIGSLLGAGGEPNLALSIVATAVVAVAFQPVRERLTRIANRLVFGHRATPYQVLSSFARHLADAATPELTLERMAKLVADGTGADRLFVWLRVGERMRATAVWPEVFLLEPVADRSLDASAVFDDFDHVEPIHHDGELLGAITISEPRGEALNHTEHALLGDVAGQAALVLRNLRLTAELTTMVEELHGSRQRIVRAQDEERRRLQRELRGGAQRRLTHLARGVHEAAATAQREGAEQAAELLVRVADDGQEAIRTVRELAHGVYPPVLAAEGLAGALAAQAAKAALPITVEVEGIGRYHQDVEAAVYFCVLEAVTNAAKYAHASHVTVTLAETDGHLTFTVVDDGAGFDPTATVPGRGLTNMTDRLDALGGVLDISSRSGDGTEVTGTVPVTSHTAAPVPA